ncbi:helicase [Clostridia bacterium]|nr:helicase [Clostridia bacterium]
MPTGTTATNRIDEQILVIDKAICRHLDSFDGTNRGELSQDILKNLRDFTEHLMYKAYAVFCLGQTDIENNYNLIYKKSKQFIEQRGDLKLLSRFHSFLQSSVSHYMPDEESSERLMLKYYEYLLKIRDLAKRSFSLDVLDNLEKFPINTDETLQEYYEKIAARVDANMFNLQFSHNDVFYIHKIKPFFVNRRIFYEVTFFTANGRTNKTERIIAFTAIDISKFYAIRLWLIDDDIQILGKNMPVFVIAKWETSIRPAEIEHFSTIFGKRLANQRGTKEYQGLMEYLTQTGFNLVELVCFEDAYYQHAKRQIIAMHNATKSNIFDLLDECREIILAEKRGCNILRYLLFHLKNDVIKSQLDRSNDILSGLHLSYGCIPFDDMPFISSPKEHIPRISDLFECIDATKRKHELLARYIRANIETKGQLYTPVAELERFGNVNELIRLYNQTLYYKHTKSHLRERSGHVYIRSYEDDTVQIIKQLIELSSVGIQNYASSMETWIDSGTYAIDSDEKKAALQHMFTDSQVALIYGSAGTGKSTLINHISHFFADANKLYLAHTNPAVDNLRRRVTTPNKTVMTITKFLTGSVQSEFDVLVIDECSMVDNRNMKAILEKCDFTVLILVGDVYQIEAIQFGNWFTAVRGFLPNASVCELKNPYRTSNQGLLTLWNRVRKMDETILEAITHGCYSNTLDASIFDPAQEDEIILCLNYDGLYGINNINRFLQEANPHPTVSWGIQLYKIGDPVLFLASDRFGSLVYNNSKGRIVGVVPYDDHVQFDIELDKVINGLEARWCDFELLENSTNGNSVIRFVVDKYRRSDEDDNDASSRAVVPFQVAYAVSIHKAQGLEYGSVKIVITDEIDELITHSIFYTAITRAREKLKIYWTPEVEQKVLNTIKPKDIGRDISLLRQVIQGG